MASSPGRYKDLGPTILLKLFGNSPKLRMLDIFFDNPLFDFSKTEVVKELGMSKTTFYKNFRDLEEIGLVRVSRKFGKTKLYKINMQHPVVKRLNEIVHAVSMEMAEQERAKLKVPVEATSSN